MAKNSYTKVKVWVSRRYCNTEGCLEDSGLYLFHSLEEYKKMAEERGWKGDGMPTSERYTRPIQMEVLFDDQTYQALTLQQAPVSPLGVFIPISFASEFHLIGNWQR